MLISKRKASERDGNTYGREPINAEWLADFGFDTHSGLKSDTNPPIAVSEDDRHIPPRFEDTESLGKRAAQKGFILSK
jgi:hypothetical protein